MKRKGLWVMLAILGTAAYLVAMAGPMPASLRAENPVEVLIGILLIAAVASGPVWLVLLIFGRKHQ